jgi:pimeloyl-ACP methyl ester carboxylesterase
MTTTTTTITPRERAEIDAANASGRQPVLFVHGLWLLAGSWNNWKDLFEANGYAAVAADWPDDPATVDEGRANPQTFAHKTVGQVADHVAEVAAALNRKPIVIGHSFGGLLTQIVVGRGLGAGAVAIDPAPFKGVLPLPFSALRSAFPVLHNPANYGRSIMLTPDQFRYSFTNMLSEDEAAADYATYPVPTPGAPLFQAGTANLRFGGQTRADTKNPERGPLLIISGENDTTVPFAMAHAAYKKQRRNRHSVTEFIELPGRGHSLVFDSGWTEVAQTALAFLAKNGLGADENATVGGDA